MKKLWVVHDSGEWPTHIWGVYDTEEQARTEVNKSSFPCFYEISEIPMNASIEQEEKRLWGNGC